MPQLSSRARLPVLLAAFAAVYLIWGSTYLGIVYAIKSIPPFLMAGLRFAVAGAVLFALVQWRAPAKATRRQWLNAALVGLLLLVMGNGLVVWAEKRIPSSVAALLVTTEPIWVVLLVWLQTRRAPRGLVWAGLALGAGGVLLLVGPGVLGSLGQTDLWGALAVLLATMGWATGSVLASRADLPQNGVRTSAMQMLCGGAAMLLLSVGRGEWVAFRWQAVLPESWLAWGYLTVFGSLVAFSAYGFLTRHVSPSLAATYAYVNPLIAVALGVWLAHEPFTLGTAEAGALMIGGVVLISISQRGGGH